MLVLCHPKEHSRETGLLKLAHLSLEDGTIAGTSYIIAPALESLDAHVEMFWSLRPDVQETKVNPLPWLTRMEAHYLMLRRQLDRAAASGRSRITTTPELCQRIRSDAVSNVLLPLRSGIRSEVRRIDSQAAYPHNRPAVDDSALRQEPYHPVLGSFPAALQNVKTAAVLCIPGLKGRDNSGASFLGGSFPLPYSPASRQVDFDRVIVDTQARNTGGEAVHARPTTDQTTIAEASSSAKGYLNTILRGIQACQGIWRDDIDKERIRWVDELEDAARTHGSESAQPNKHIRDAGLTMSHDAATFKNAHADLTRLLLAGRSGEAITQFLGGRITEKVCFCSVQSLACQEARC